LGAAVVVIIAALFLLYQAETFDTGAAPLNLPQTVTLPTIGIAVNGTQELTEPDIIISITLQYVGTLVTGTQTPVNISAVAHCSVPNDNVSRIYVSLQDALAWPNIPAQDFKIQIGATLKPSNDGVDFGGSTMMYFPLEGNFSPTVSVEANETNANHQLVTHFYLPQVLDIGTVQVQPTSVLTDEKTASNNLQLTRVIFLVGVVGLFGIGFQEIENAGRHLRRRHKVEGEAIQEILRIVREINDEVHHDEGD
jgi:hypothetical protein